MGTKVRHMAQGVKGDLQGVMFQMTDLGRIIIEM